MSSKYLNDSGLSYFWGKLKAYFAPKAHTHNAFEMKHSYTTAANAAKNWYRIANANTSQLDTTKPIRAQFIVTAYNTSYAADYYETWFVNAIVFGRQAHIIIFGGSSIPFNQARILYENTVANIDANDRPAIDLYLNYVLPNGTTKIEVEEIYNSGWTFVANGQLAASTIPSGFESIASVPYNKGVNNSNYADYVNYLNRQINNITAAFTLADTWLYRSRTLNCTGTFTITIPSINSGYMWCVIKNKNTSSGVITLHPSTTSVLIDGSNADIKLQPMEYVCIHSAGANNYSLIADGRFSIKTVASAKSVSTENPSTHTKLFYTVGQPAVGTTAGKAYEGSSSDYSLLSFPANGTVHNTSANIQNLRLMWINSTTYFTDIFVSPNNHYIWHRDVMNNNAYGWRRLVEENVTGITAPTWDISIGGNAATASAVAWSGVTSKPTTIAGYGITDAKIANGTITLGSNSITPLTSHQDISGKVDKTGDTMTGDLNVPNLYFDYSIYKKHPNIVKGTNPSEIRFWSLRNCDKNGIDYANNMLGVVETSANPNGTVHTYIRAIKNEAGSQANGTIGVAYDTANNYAYTYAPTPTSPADNTDKIATTEWVRTATGNTALNADGSFGLTMLADLGSNYQMNVSDFSSKPVCVWHVDSFADNTTSAPSSNVGDFTLTRLYTGLTNYACILCTSPRTTRVFYGHFWEGTWSGWNTLHMETVNLQFEGNANAVLLSKDNDSLFLCGGTSIQSNSFIGLSGGTNSSGDTPGAFYIHAKTNNTDDKVLAGTPGGTLTWWGQNIQTTSDQRLKTKLESVPDDVLDAWEGVEWGQFRYLEAVASKGGTARLHSGLVSQQVQEAFSARGLDACAYGLVCHETRDAVDEDVAVETRPAYTDEEGVFHPEEKTTEHRHEDAVDLWMIRYAEALCMEAACQRRENARLKKRIADLEERLAALELKVS